MNPGLVVKLRPVGPWRIGPDSGARNRVDVIYHSDSLYAAVTAAMATLGWLHEWLDATARREAGAAVRFSSCFPFLDEFGYVVPPRTMWPPTASGRVRWRSARFVPLNIVRALLDGQLPDENHWTIDGTSECLVPEGRQGPFRTGVRWSAAVDRLTGTSERHSTACLEFRAGAGLWAVLAFADDQAQAAWSDRVKMAFRVLADTGFGGERSRGWGRSEQPEFVDGVFPDMILTPSAVKDENAASGSESQPAVARAAAPQWLLSLFTPAASDAVDWARGNYEVVSRGGRIESAAGSGGLKKQLNMISEGSVLYAGDSLSGTAADVAPDGFAHPVFRAGFAVAIPLPGEVG